MLDLGSSENVSLFVFDPFYIVIYILLYKRNSNMEQLLIIDSRDREDQAGDRTDIRIVFQKPITFSRISLLFMDMPNDSSDTESIYYITVDELPNGIRGSKISDNATFCQIKTIPEGFRSMSFENLSFNQEIDLKTPQLFTEFNIHLRYRQDAVNLAVNNDYSIIFKTFLD
jgi:hypothetical protein